MVLKAAERSRRQRQESFCEPIALMRWSSRGCIRETFRWMMPSVSRLVRVQQIVRKEVIS